MKVTYIEGLLLAVYLEFFNRCYDPTDTRIYGLDPKQQMPTRHMEMQHIIYILQCLYVELPDYGFCWSELRSPFSGGLELILKRLDEKGFDAIDEFYAEYNEKRQPEHYSRYKNQLVALLGNYFRNSSIYKIADTSLALEEVLKQDQGSDLLASITYLIQNGPSSSSKLPEVLKRLDTMGKESPDSELAKDTWEALAIIGIRKREEIKDAKVFTNRRLERYTHN